VRYFEIVLHRLERFLVAVKPDKANARGWDQLQHSVQQPVACTQDRDQRELATLKRRRLHFLKRRFDCLLGHGQIARDLIGQNVLVPHQRELVLHKRVINDFEVIGHVVSLIIRMVYPKCVGQAQTGKRSEEGFPVTARGKAKMRGEGFADICKADMTDGFASRPDAEHRHTLAGVIRAGPSGVVAVVCGDE